MTDAQGMDQAFTFSIGATLFASQLSGTLKGTSTLKTHYLMEICTPGVQCY